MSRIKNNSLSPDSWIPETSYCIWFSPRSGSTLLCKALEETGVAGVPGEYFTIQEDESLLEKYQVDTFHDFLKKLQEIGTTSNGVFGLKHSMSYQYDQNLLGKLHHLSGCGNYSKFTDFLSETFPNCKHIILCRRNKIRQAVSWWRAIREHVWHVKTSDKEVNFEGRFNVDLYDFHAIKHLMQEAMLRECAVQEFFNNKDIVPLQLVYEDMIPDLHGTIVAVLQHLGIKTNGLETVKTHYMKMADQYSEIWVQRFRKDLQAEMGQTTW